MKKTLLIPTTLLAILALASCGTKTSTPTESTGTPDTGATTGTDTGTDTNPGTDTDTTPEPLTEDQMAAKLVADFDTAIANHEKIVSVRFDHGMDYADMPYEPVTDVLDYGSNDAIHYTETSWGTTTDHYVYKDGENIYAYNVDADGRVLPDYSYGEDSLKGVDVTNFGFYNPSGYGVYYYTFEEIAKLSAEAAVTNVNNDRVITMPTANSYEVSFNSYYSDDWDNKYYYSVELAVEFDESTKALKKLHTETWLYDSYQVELSADGTFEIIEDAMYSRVVNYEATVGTRTPLTVPYDVSEFYFTSFGLAYNDDEVAQNSTITVDYEFGSYDPITFTFIDVLPSTANSRFDQVVVTVTDKETGEQTYDASGNVYNGELSLYPNTSGEFTIALNTRDFSFTFNLTVNMDLPSPESFTIWEVLYVGGDYPYHYTDTPKESYTLGETVGFNATVNPWGADGSYTMTLTCDGEPAQISYDSYVEYEMTYYYYVATLSKAGTYVLTATSTAEPTVSSFVTFTVA